jgi:predicted ATPase
MQFKNWIESLHCLQLNPHAMAKKTDREDAGLAFDMSNFASWYRHMNQEREDAASKFRDQLRQILPGLGSLNLRSTVANLRSLEARFDIAESSPEVYLTVAFDELSDGQRVLTCLYALLNFVVEGNACLFLDEPENYIAIPEIQPWLVELRDRIEDRGGQVILISHHPEIIDYLAPEIGLVFERVGTGPVRVRNYSPDACHHDDSGGRLRAPAGLTTQIYVQASPPAPCDGCISRFLFFCDGKKTWMVRYQGVRQMARRKCRVPVRRKEIHEKIDQENADWLHSASGSGTGGRRIPAPRQSEGGERERVLPGDIEWELPVQCCRVHYGRAFGGTLR